MGQVHMTLQEELDGEGLRAERAFEQGHWSGLLLDGQDSGGVGDDDVSVEFRFGTEDASGVFGRRTAGATVQFRFATVLDSQMNLD